jgi:hypothetical protein
MRILFDNGTPAPLRYALKGHVVVEAIERGWDRLANGELIAVAEAAGDAATPGSYTEVDIQYS